MAVQTVANIRADVLGIQWGAVSPRIDNGPFNNAPPGPLCRYGSQYLNAQGCGSYVADWFDPPTFDNPGLGSYNTYYMLKKDSTSIADRGAKWYPNSPDNGQCQFCPAAAYDCPTIRITKVTKTPECPKQNEPVTLTCEFSYDLKGFSLTTNNGVDTNFRPIWTVENPVTGVPSYYSGTRVTLPGFVIGGEYNVTVGVSMYYSDPDVRCPVMNQNGTPALNLDGSPAYDPPWAYGFQPFTIKVLFPYQYNDPNACSGTTNPDPDPPPAGDPVEPSITASISGPTTVQLGADGTATAEYVMDYDLDDGDFILSNRVPYYTWDGKSPQTTDRRYRRTFDRTSIGDVDVTGKVALFYCYPDDPGPCTVADTEPAERKWVIAEEKLRVTVKDYVDQSVKPSGSITVRATTSTSPTLNNDGEAFVSFEATASYSDGTFTPTADPTALYVNSINGNFNSSTLYQNVTNATWTSKFTSAGSRKVGARFRKNYTDSSGNLILDDDVTVNIQAAPTTGTKPTATIRQEMDYSSELNGCGYGIAGVGVDVTCTATIDLTPGTGAYEWDAVTTSTGNWVKNGNTLQQTIVRRSSTVRQFEGTFGTTVEFRKGGVNGQIVHTDGSGTADWCINFESFNINL